MPQPRGIQWVETGATATGTTSLSLGPPAGILDNDILLGFISHRGSGFGTWPAGWTLVDRDVAGSVRGEWYWKRCASESGSYSVTGLADSAVGYIVGIRGLLLSGSPIGVQTKRVNASGDNGCGPLTTVARASLMVMVTMQANELSGLTQGVRHAQSPSTDSALSFDPELSSMGTWGAVRNATAGGAALNAARQMKMVPGSTIDDFRIVSGDTVDDNVCMAASFTPETGGATTGTRYYLTPITPVSPRREPWGLVGDWDDTWLDGKPSKHIVISSMLSQQCQYDGTFSHRTAGSTELATNQQGDFDAMYRRFLTPPLAAQTLSGTFQCTLGMNIRWKNTLGTLSNDSVARLKIHMFVTEGQSTDIRSTIIDNFVDGANINNANNNIIWTGLTTPADVSGTVIEEGDSIGIEIGIRVVSSPTPTPSFPPSEWTQFQLYAIGSGNLATTASLEDGVIGNIAVVGECAHFDFSATLNEADWLPDSNTNVSPATATEIATLPFSEVAAPYETHGSTANACSGWYALTAPSTGTLVVTARGTMGNVVIQTVTGPTTDYADLTLADDTLTFNSHTNQRCVSVQALPVTEGETYYIRLNGDTQGGYNTLPSLMSLSVAYQEVPASGDKFLPNGIIQVFRGHAMVNFNQDFDDFAPTGVAIDYTRRPMDSFAGENTNYRLYVSLFGATVIEILDLTSLNRDEQEIDFITDPLELQSGRFTPHLAALHMTRAGYLYQQSFGNNFRYVIGFAQGITADLSGRSEFEDEGYVRGLDGLHADDQPGNPWPLAAELATTDGQTPSWHGGVNESTGLLYYSSSGLYVTLPVALPTTTGNGQIARSYDVINDAQGPNLATLAASGLNQGLKGMCVGIDGSIFICNGGNMIRVTSGGTVIQTYTPSSDYPVSLVDAELDPDGVHIWVIDMNSIDLFQFNIQTGAQTDRIRTWGSPRNLIQFAIFTPEPIPEPFFTIDTEIRPIRWLRQSPHVSANMKRAFHSLFQLDMEVGVGLREGLGSEPLVAFEFSTDGGKTWGNTRYLSMGKRGETRQLMQWWRQGMARDAVYRIYGSDPVMVRIVGAYLSVEEGTDA